jgi:hypothetical protein
LRELHAASGAPLAASFCDSRKPMNVWGGIKDNMVKLAPINATVPAEVKD